MIQFSLISIFAFHVHFCFTKFPTDPSFDRGLENIFPFRSIDKSENALSAALFTCSYNTLAPSYKNTIRATLTLTATNFIIGKVKMNSLFALLKLNKTLLKKLQMG